MRLRRNEKYCLEEIESKEFWSTMMILDPYKKNWKKERKHVSSKKVAIFKYL
jgi:hypothetical protein